MMIQKEIYAMTNWISKNLGDEVPIHFSAFHPDYKMMDKPRTSLQTVQQACSIARDNGLKYVYTGNVHDPKNDSTFCPNCGEILIGRDWYDLSEWNLDSSKCKKCSQILAGHFNQKPGDWGRKRQSVEFCQSKYSASFFGIIYRRIKIQERR